MVSVAQAQRATHVQILASVGSAGAWVSVSRVKLDAAYMPRGKMVDQRARW